MAADNVAELISTQTLAANVAETVNLTGHLGSEVELIHHGNVTDHVYYQIANLEADLTTFAIADDEIGILLSGERLTVGIPPSGLWIKFLCAGAAVTTVCAKF